MDDRIQWGEKYPEQARLRSEVMAMVRAIRDVAFDELGEKNIRGIYHKGSGNKPWDSILDYVPEISDVDIHVWLRDRSQVNDLRNMETALRFQAGIEAGYSSAVAGRVHTPRPQVIVLNELMEDEQYVPSPPNTVGVVYGEQYPTSGRRSAAEIRVVDAQSLRSWYEEAIDLGLSVLDKPGRYAWGAVRSLSYRVSPVGSRVLSVLGVEPDLAWSMNRSAIVRELESRGFGELSEAIMEYYLAGWEYFLSGFDNTDAARAAIRNGFEVLRLGHSVAKGAE